MTPAIDGADVARLAQLAARAGDNAGTAAGLVRHEESSTRVVADVLLNRRPRAATGFTKAADAGNELATGLKAAGDTRLAEQVSSMAVRAATAATEATGVGFAAGATPLEGLQHVVRNGRVAGDAARFDAGFAAVRSAADAGTPLPADGAALGAAVLGARVSDGTLAGADGAAKDAASAADLARTATRARPVRARHLLAQGVREYAQAWSQVDGDRRLAGRATPESLAVLAAGGSEDHRALPVIARRVRAAAEELHGDIGSAGPVASTDPQLVLQDHAWSAARAMHENLLAHGESTRRTVAERGIALTLPNTIGVSGEAKAVLDALPKNSPARAALQAVANQGAGTTWTSTPNLFDILGNVNGVSNVARALSDIKPATGPDAAMGAAEQLEVLGRAKAHVQKARELWVSAGEHEYPTGATDMFGGSTTFTKTYRGWRYVARTGLTNSLKEVGQAGSELMAARRLLARVVDEDVAGTGKVFSEAINASADHMSAASTTVLNLDTMGTSWLTKHAVETVYPKHHDIGKTQAALTALDAMIDGMVEITHGQLQDEAVLAKPAAPVAGAAAVVDDAAAAKPAAAAAAKQAEADVLGF